MTLSFNIQKAKLALLSRGNYQLEGVFHQNELTQAEIILDRLMNSSSYLIQSFRSSINCSLDSTSQQTELIRPSVLSRALRQSDVFHTAQTIATAVLGTKAHYHFDHVIYKEPLGAPAIPWHQDQAYSGSRPSSPSIHLWIPFQDSAPTNGGMIFIEDNRIALLNHIPVTQGSRTLTIDQPVSGKVRWATVKRGGLSLHHNFTVHASGENLEDQTRKAWILHFSSTTLWHKYGKRLWSSLSRRHRA